MLFYLFRQDAMGPQISRLRDLVVCNRELNRGQGDITQTKNTFILKNIIEYGNAGCEALLGFSEIT